MRAGNDNVVRRYELRSNRNNSSGLLVPVLVEATEDTEVDVVGGVEGDPPASVNTLELVGQPVVQLAQPAVPVVVVIDSEDSESSDGW